MDQDGPAAYHCTVDKTSLSGGVVSMYVPGGVLVGMCRRCFFELVWQFGKKRLTPGALEESELFYSGSYGRFFFIFIFLFMILQK